MKPRTRSQASRSPAGRKRSGGRKRRGTATRLRSAIRTSFKSSPIGRGVRKTIRSISQTLHNWFAAAPTGPVRLGLLCCVLAFVAAGSMNGCPLMDGRSPTRTPDSSATSRSAPGGDGAALPLVLRPKDERPAPLFPATRATAGMPRPIRAVWVARFHYRDPADIAEIMRNCRSIGANTVLWQVRGEAAVAYPSRIEPWSREYNNSDPGFDPLAIAVREAHENGLRIEAWCNVLPAWKGNKPPTSREHVYHKHPEWFLHDARGRRQPLGDDYIMLNPCNEAVRRYLVSVFEEIAGGYAIDGLHLDYVRYAWDLQKNARNLYPRDAETLAVYFEQTGKKPDDDPRAWDHWRANQLTRLVADIREMLDRRRPGAALTAAVRGDLYQGYNDYFQNAVAWLRSGLLDAAYPMAYTQSLETLDRMVNGYRTIVPEGRVIPGLGVYMLETAESFAQQLDFCTASGGDYALYSYESLFAPSAERGRADAKIGRLRAGRVEILSDMPK